MSIETIDTLIVGCGQAGLAMSEHLRNAGEPHLILERHRIAERWHSERWDSLVANGPAWHDRFPSMEFTDIDPDGFPTKHQVADYFSAYAEMIKAPVRCGVDVLSAERMVGKTGFRVHTSEGVIEAENIIAATGAFQHPVIPPIIPADAELVQLHSNGYHNPQQLPEGSVLVIGAGSSGAQIADELLQSGRKVFLSVGPHDRPPRRYRGRDFVWWLGVLGKWDATTPGPNTEHVTIAVSGAHGGCTIDFRRFAGDGMTLLGMTESYSDGTLRIADDLASNISQGDASYLSILDEADAYIESHGIALPEEPQAREMLTNPECVEHPIRSLNLLEEGISSVIWATGYRVDYSWLKADVFDDQGRPKHQRGVSDESGVFFLGLPWQSRRGSSFIWGVWHDAKYLADHIGRQRFYQSYGPTSSSPSKQAHRNSNESPG